MVVGIATLPNQRHKIVSRQGANFNLMVVGESGTGKTTFIHTLFATTLKEPRRYDERHNSLKSTTRIEVVRAVMEEKGFEVRLNVVDTPGFGDVVNNTECWAPVVQYLDQQHLGYLNFEQSQEFRDKLDKDNRIHACLYFIRPTGHTLSALDIKAMEAIGSRVNLIPIIGKADTISPKDIARFKERIRECIAFHKISTYTPPIESDDEDHVTLNQLIASASPYAIIGSETEVLVNGNKTRGRAYRWGIAEVENEEHCDFVKLRSLLIRTHMHDLVNTTHEIHYENFRSKRLTSQGKNDDDPVQKAKKSLAIQMKEDEDNLRRRFTEQVRLEENRFRQWEQKLIAERDRLNKDLEEHHKMVKELEREYEELHEQLRNGAR